MVKLARHMVDLRLCLHAAELGWIVMLQTRKDRRQVPSQVKDDLLSTLACPVDIYHLELIDSYE